MAMDREQLEALRRQIEEDYRLDMGAIERLQRRFIGETRSVSNVSSSSLPSRNAAPVSESYADVLPRPEAAPSAPQPDELTSSLRAMFSSSSRK